MVAVTWANYIFISAVSRVAFFGLSFDQVVEYLKCQIGISHKVSFFLFYSPV